MKNFAKNYVMIPFQEVENKITVIRQIPVIADADVAEQG